MVEDLYSSFDVVESDVLLQEEDVVELPLLLPGWQVSKLETMAHEGGMTTAEMVRHLLRDFLVLGGPPRIPSL